MKANTSSPEIVSKSILQTLWLERQEKEFQSVVTGRNFMVLVTSLT